MKTQRIIFYTQLAYQLLGTTSDIVTYPEFLSAFDDITATARARGQSFEKVYVDIPTMLQWLRDNGHKNNNAGRAAYSDIDHVPKQTFAAANFRNILGPVSPWPSRINYAALPHMDPFRYAARLRGYLAMHGAFGWPPFP